MSLHSSSLAPASYLFHGTFNGVKTGHRLEFVDVISSVINGPRGIPQQQYVYTRGFITFVS